MLNQDNTTTDRIYIFENGTQIDLKQVICIGKLEKSSLNTIFLPIHCKGYNKPIEIILGYSIGTVDEKQKNKINLQYNDFLNSWNYYIKSLI